MAGSSVRSITLTGTNLLDSNNFAEVSLTNTYTKQTTVFAATSASSTSVVFNLPSTLASGNYDVKVRNALGESNARSLAVGWSTGTASWGLGGSTAGGIVTIANGGGYPSSIDGNKFTITLTSGKNSYPVNIVSCCASNTIQLELPPAANGTSFTIMFTGPINTA